jgi:hypothetical protein
MVRSPVSDNEEMVVANRSTTRRRKLRRAIARGFFVALIAVTAQQLPAIAVPASAAAPSGGQSSNSVPPAATSGPQSSNNVIPTMELPTGWQRSSDRAVTTVGDADGLHVLAAEESKAYQWRDVVTLSEPVTDSSQWVGQACVTGSGTRAVVVYAPREYTNRADATDRGAFVAIVDLASGAVRKLAQRVSLAYFDPGCGVGERVALTSACDDGSGITSTITVVDAVTGATVMQATVPGQLTSAVPSGDGVAAARGTELVSVGAGGAVSELGRQSGTLLRLHPDQAGGIGFQVASGIGIDTMRYAKGRTTMLGHARLGTVQLMGSAGHVFVIGSGNTSVSLPSGWVRTKVPVNSDISTTGVVAVTGAGLSRTSRAGLTVDAAVVGTGQTHHFDLPRQSGGGGPGAVASPALRTPDGAPKSATRMDPPAPSTVPYDPDRWCAVPRNDPTIQTLQPTAAQVEWAVDRAVSGQLLVNRPANWMGSGVPVSWQPQVMFPPLPLIGGGSVPAQVLLGILAQESNTMQASPHAVDGVTGNVNQGGFYGDGLDWSNADCGYGIGQVTSGMAKSDGIWPACSANPTGCYTANQQLALATDYASNIAASLNALVSKWNELQSANIVANDGGSQYIENWYLAAWAYNTGVQPDAQRGNTTGCTPSPSCTDGAGNWGLGWANNPANPNYPADRANFLGSDNYDAIHQNMWPYQEKVIGWAYSPLVRYSYAAGAWESAYSAGYWVATTTDLPPNSFFCVAAVNNCVPDGTTDLNGNPGAGLCEASLSHCWWHQSSNVWNPCTGNVCGVQAILYLNATEPANGNVYPPDCSTTGLIGAPGAAIVDDVTTPSPLCSKTWTNQGTFALSFPYQPPSPADCPISCINYPGKIDFHQLSTGFGGHLWFTHTSTVTSVTGTWTPPSSFVGWTRIEVHIPQSGATTEQADYQIYLGNGVYRHRVVNQAWYTNTWVDLGAFPLGSGANVSLSNASPNVAISGADGGDIAFDAAAFIPSSYPVASYVALGDSYSSGESNSPFTADSDQSGADQCHRSQTQAYSNLLQLPGQSQPIAAMAANNQANFHFLACSGASSVDLTQATVDTNNTDNTPWRTSEDYHMGEVNQIDDSGWLDSNTTLVTLSIGGNDVGFADVLQGCLDVSHNCLAPDFYLTRTFGDYVQTSRIDTQPLTTYEPYLITQLRSRLAATYEQVHLQAPNAQILVIGYPHLFTNVIPLQFCTGLTSQVQQWLNDMADQVRTQEQNAVADTILAYPGTSITFVDAIPGFTNHGVCDSGGKWLNAVDPENRSYSFHPNSAGQAGYASIINGIL